MTRWGWPASSISAGVMTAPVPNPFDTLSVSTPAGEMHVAGEGEGHRRCRTRCGRGLRRTDARLSHCFRICRLDQQRDDEGDRRDRGDASESQAKSVRTASSAVLAH